MSDTPSPSTHVRGYVLVPIKPTKAMMQAAIDLPGIWPEEAKATWKAMVKAAKAERPS